MPKSICILVILIAASFPSHSCGIATHAWVSKLAMTKVTNIPSDFLETYRDFIYNGSYFPDSGYTEDECNAHYGEIAHWPPFMNMAVAYIKELCRLPNGSISTMGECGELISYFLGAASHGLTDNWHDSHFLVKMVELGYFPDADAVATVTDRGLDATAVNDLQFGIVNDIPNENAKPPLHHLVNILNRTVLDDPNHEKFTFEAVECGTELMSMVRFFEPTWAYYEAPKYLLKMPQWALDNRLTAPGGVYDNARVVAEYWEELWIQITETPKEKYRPKYLRGAGGWPMVKIWWEDASPTRSQSRTKSN